MKKHAAPVIAATLLLLPVLYVGSYLGMVSPCRQVHRQLAPNRKQTTTYNYRIDSRWPSNVFWPLELIDRRVRPGLWDWRNKDP
jgi:hypothetical protein